MARKDEESPSSGSDDNHDNGRAMSADLDAIDLDQLGRQRPDVFPNLAYEILFCSSLLISMFMAVSLEPEGVVRSRG